MEIIDAPNDRSSHSTPTARGGGLAISSTAVLFLLIQWLYWGDRALLTIMLGLVVLMVVSFLDDLKPLPSSVRLLVHGCVALGVLYLFEWPVVALQLSPLLTLPFPAVVGLALGFLWLVGYMNAFNFMDGINGLATGQVIVTSIGSIFVVGLGTGLWLEPAIMFYACLAGAALGFLPFNYPQARMFMGDVGSIPLGFILAAIAIWVADRFGWFLLVPLTLLHTNFVLDTSLTIIRRAFSREPIGDPHRDHFYQRLVRAGKSHAFVTNLEIGLQLLTVLLMLYYHAAATTGRLCLIGATLLIWVAFFVFSETVFRSETKRNEC
ncbi:glycosyltransferase family 4 protein [Oligoflexia bacterium]|nr:glycosyltransferase family 4 protein [Oligoflexia bacterium]